MRTCGRREGGGRGGVRSGGGEICHGRVPLQKEVGWEGEAASGQKGWEGENRVLVGKKMRTCGRGGGGGRASQGGKGGGEGVPQRAGASACGRGGQREATEGGRWGGK
jgi:hypothetical protein